jgi:hypothetical protein
MLTRPPTGTVQVSHIIFIKPLPHFALLFVDSPVFDFYCIILKGRVRRVYKC